jgi:CHASE3 domain sensor protein
MLHDWTIGRKVGAGFAIAAIALIVVAVTAYRSTQTLVTSTERVLHTHEVQRELDSLLVELLNGETATRGFVITGTDTFLDPYRTAVPAIDRSFTALRAVTADHPEQQRRLDTLRPMLDERLAQFQTVIEQRRKSPEAAATLVTTGEGRRTMDKVRAAIDDMNREEDRLLAQRQEAADESTRLASAVILWGSIAAVILSLLVGWWIASSVGKQIGTAVQQVQSSSTELQAAANQQASGASEQATAMSEIATTISELLATSRQIAQSAQRVSQIAGQTATAARLGDATVIKGNETSAVVRKQVDLVVTHMLELGKRSQQVGAVLDLVAELAEQTNILAINATIEAAGAGETGRRFGVVADEIRKLADRVAGSTKEIRALVDDVRGAVNTTVMVTEAGSKAVDAGAAQVLEMATAFRQIASLVATTTDAAREIELSTKQQTTAVEQVNVAIANIAQAARETESSAKQTLQTSVQLTGLSRDLMRIVEVRVG